MFILYDSNGTVHAISQYQWQDGEYNNKILAMKQVAWRRYTTSPEGGISEKLSDFTIETDIATFRTQWKAATTAAQKLAIAGKILKLE